jgi:hypothetical protein
MKEIEDLYIKDSFFSKAGKVYLSGKNAISFIKECEIRELAILGFDGFKIDGNSIIPQLEYIADFSSIIKKQETWHKVVKYCKSATDRFFSEARDENIYYDFVVVDQDRWKSSQ